MTRGANISKRCRAAFLKNLQDNRPDFEFDEKGYLRNFKANLLPGVDCEHFESDLRSGDGNELETKFKAPHSSSALAVNVFAPFKVCKKINDLHMLKAFGFQTLTFEVKYPTGLKTRRSPNLDVVLESENDLIAVESKCTEYVSRKTAKFSPAYDTEILDDRRNGPWFAEMKRLTQPPGKYQHLDVAQLIKHAFGLELHAALHGLKSIGLLYLFWEPANASSEPCFEKHRREIEDFTHIVQGSRVSFSALSYPELWKNWRTDNIPWLNDHLDQLERRYLIPI